MVWPLTLLLHVLFLHRNERVSPLPEATRHWLGWMHPAGVWLGVALLADLLWALIDRAGLWGTAWASVIGLVACATVLAALTWWAGPAARRAAGRWPLKPHAIGYLWLAALPLVGLALLGVLVVGWTSPGDTAPLPYIPLLNPTDLALALALGSILLWRHAVLRATPRPAPAAYLGHTACLGALRGLALIAISTMWLRVAHHVFQVPWTASELFDSFVVQTGYSILWTALALGLMVVAHRRARRPVWLVGAALLALVVAKLVLIDLTNSGGAERIVAFIGVGALVLVMGYVAPLPPGVASRVGEVES